MKQKTFNLHLQTFEFKSLLTETKEDLNKSKGIHYHKTYYTEHQRNFCIIKDKTTIRKEIPHFHSKYLCIGRGHILASNTKPRLTNTDNHHCLLQSKGINTEDAFENRIKTKHVKASTEQLDLSNNNNSNVIGKFPLINRPPQFSNPLLRSIYS